MGASWLADNARAFWDRYVRRALGAALFGFVLAFMVALIVLTLLFDLTASCARGLFRCQRG
jgi:hypothetical protein